MKKRRAWSVGRGAKGRDYGGVIMWAAVLVSAPRWAGAFIAADTAAMPPLIDGLLNYANMLSGLAMGPLEVIGAAYLLDAWGRMKPRKTHNAKRRDQRWLILTGFVVGLFLLMPLILAPYIVARMNQATVAAVVPTWFQYAWAVAVVLSPAFIVGGGAVARDGLVGGGDREVARVSRKPAGNENETGPVASKPKEMKKVVMARMWKPGMGPTELARLADVSKGYASKFINRAVEV